MTRIRVGVGTMNLRSQTNQWLYMARLMLDKAESETHAVFCQAAEDAAIVFMHRAFRTALAEVGESYGVTISPDAPLTDLLDRLGRDRPDGWEYRQVTESLRQTGHWMRQLRLHAEQWALNSREKPSQTGGGELIEVVAQDNQDDTNHYRAWLADLQEWVDEIRTLGDFS